MKEIGTIRLNGKVQITDPCYELGIWCAANLPVKKGIYRCFVKNIGKRISELIIMHEEYANESNLENEFTDIKDMEFVMGVDSGQAGFFDYDYFVSKQEKKVNDEWYNKVCDITLSDESCGTIDELGCVTSSGYGDGGYDVFSIENDKYIRVGFRVVFIEEDW